MSVRLELPSLPERLTAQASFPAVVMTYAAAHRDEEVRGVSSGTFEPGDAGTSGPTDGGASGSALVPLADAGTSGPLDAGAGGNAMVPLADGGTPPRDAGGAVRTP